MHSGRYFFLDYWSEEEQGEIIFRYRKIRAKRETISKGITEVYPISVSFSSDRIVFYFHGLEYDKSSDQSDPSRHPVAGTNTSPSLSERLTKNPAYHRHYEILSLPMDEGKTRMQNLDDTLKNAALSVVEIHGGLYERNNFSAIMAEKYVNSKDASDLSLNFGYSDLEKVVRLKRDSGSKKGLSDSSIYLLSPKEEDQSLPTTTNASEEAPPLKLLQRELLLDFFFDFEQYRLFEHCPNFHEISKQVSRSFILNAILLKHHYLYCREQFLRVEKKVAAGLLPEPVKREWSKVLHKAEKKWIEVLVTEGANSALLLVPGWFYPVEKEMRVVLFSSFTGDDRGLFKTAWLYLRDLFFSKKDIFNRDKWLDYHRNSIDQILRNAEDKEFSNREKNIAESDDQEAVQTNIKFQNFFLERLAVFDSFNAAFSRKTIRWIRVFALVFLVLSFTYFFSKNLLDSENVPVWLLGNLGVLGLAISTLPILGYAIFRFRYPTTFSSDEYTKKKLFFLFSFIGLGVLLYYLLSKDNLFGGILFLVLLPPMFIGVVNPTRAGWKRSWIFLILKVLVVVAFLIVAFSMYSAIHSFRMFWFFYAIYLLSVVIYLRLGNRVNVHRYNVNLSFPRLQIAIISSWLILVASEELWQAMSELNSRLYKEYSIVLLIITLLLVFYHLYRRVFEVRISSLIVRAVVIVFISLSFSVFYSFLVVNVTGYSLFFSEVLDDAKDDDELNVVECSIQIPLEIQRSKKQKKALYDLHEQCKKNDCTEGLCFLVAEDQIFNSIQLKMTKGFRWPFINTYEIREKEAGFYSVYLVAMPLPQLLLSVICVFIGILIQIIFQDKSLTAPI